MSLATGDTKQNVLSMSKHSERGTGDIHTKRKLDIYCRQEGDPIFQLSLAEYKYKLEKDDKGQLERGKETA